MNKNDGAKAQVVAFRAVMRKLGVDDDEIQQIIIEEARDVLHFRQRQLIDHLRDALFEMSEEELKAMEGGEQ